LSGRGEGRDSGADGWARHVGVVLGAVLWRPSLWVPALGAVRRLARRGWWRRAPFLPVPGDAYWHFRLVTAYGGDGSEGNLTKEDVVAFLQWCQRTRPRGG
jgi:hypothetical protein